jgi:hypothetical protein
MKNYLVEGEFTVTVQVEVEANSEETAVELAKRRITDNYNLNIVGYDHDPQSGVEFDLDAYLESDEDDGRDDDDYGDFDDGDNY